MTPRIYEEVVDLIASGPTPAQVIEFKSSAQTKKRFWNLAEYSKDGSITAEEKCELDHYLQAEHLMRLAKAHVRLRLNITKDNRPSV